MQGLRRTYGIAEPVRREMELKDVRTGDGIGASFLRGKNVSVGEDILSGRDAEIGGWEGVFQTGKSRLHLYRLRISSSLRIISRQIHTDNWVLLAGQELREGDFHSELEAKTKMNW